MQQIYTTRRQVQFRDTDAAGIMHFSVFLLYMEQVEHEFLRQLGLSVVMKDEIGQIGWPRVSVKCDYLAPVRFEEELRIDLAVERMGKRSVTFRTRFWRDEQRIAIGTMTTVCCRIPESGEPYSAEIPNWFRDKLEGYVIG